MKGSNVVSLSGGKDSTAMLLMMLERGEPIADIVFFDTGWEFPAMYDHLEQVERYTGRTITVLRPRLSPVFITAKTPFDFMFAEYPVTKRGTKVVHKIGRGWASADRRWCTKEKTRAIHTYCNALTWMGYNLPVTQCIGFAADEGGRIAEHTQKKPPAYQVFRYPLAEWGVSESDALEYCKEQGFFWNGLYDYFDRVSCFCCPLQGLDELRTLRRHFPELWARMLEMESWLPEGDKGRRFKGNVAISDLESRFAAENAHEERWLTLPGRCGVHELCEVAP